MSEYEPDPGNEDDFDDDDTGNRLVGAAPRQVLEYVAKAIADEPEAVVVEAEEGRGREVTLRLHVSPDDMGKVIGKRGRTAAHLRTVVRAAGAVEGVDVTVDIVD